MPDLFFYKGKAIFLLYLIIINLCTMTTGLPLEMSILVMTVFVTGLRKGREYQVKMTALTVNGTGPYTGWLTATTFTSDLDESVVPEPPASLKAKASDNSITIAWNPPSSKVNIGAANLDVFGSIFFN